MLKWYKKVEFTVESYPVKEEFTGRMSFDSNVKVEVSVTNDLQTMSKRIRWFKGNNLGRDEAMRLAFQDFLDGRIHDEDIRIYSDDCRSCPPLSELKTVIVCEDEFLKQLLSEMFGVHERRVELNEGFEVNKEFESNLFGQT